MNTAPKQIQTTNYICIKELYYREVIIPVTKSLEQEIVPVEKYYNFANKIFLFKFYSTVLESKLHDAIIHNQIDKQEAVDYTIHLWDTKESGVDFIPPWPNPDYVSEKVTDATRTDSEFFKGIYMGGEESLSLFDATTNEGFFWTYDSSTLPTWVDAAPIRTILHWILSLSNTHLVHGAAVGSNGRAVFLGARGGSGKSTTALSCFNLGMDYLADDYTAIEITEKGAIAHSLYNSVKIIEKVDEEKVVTFLSKRAPQQIKRNAPMAAILVPKIAHRKKTTFVPASKTEVLLALLPTTIFQLPLADSDKVKSLGEIINKTPCYFLELSEDRNEVAKTIKNFLENGL